MQWLVTGREKLESIEEGEEFEGNAGEDEEGLSAGPDDEVGGQWAKGAREYLEAGQADSESNVQGGNAVRSSLPIPGAVRQRAVHALRRRRATL
jgi:hypothetical protein